MVLWEEVRGFLDANPSPGEGRRFDVGEVRFTMGMHRYYLERSVDFGGGFHEALSALAGRHGLRLDERDAANFVVFDRNNEYIGRVQESRLILMPQKMSRPLFDEFLRLYAPEAVS